jgi:cytosine/uracil/thiamine/allantoin permease
MKLVQDIIHTWKILRKPGSNYRAIHAGSSMVIGFVLMLASIWCLSNEWPELFRAGWFFILGVCFLLYWRYLLPEAMWRTHIQRVLEDAKTKHREGKKNGGV